MTRDGSSAEPMADFFDARADGYDDHMRANVADFSQFYTAIAAPIAPTRAPIRVLDLGCGTGLELQALLDKAPNARIIGIDLSAAMLRRMMRKYQKMSVDLTAIQGSYLALPFVTATSGSGFDVAVSVMTVHHLLPGDKRALYRRVRQILKPGGTYVEGDYVVVTEQAKAMLEAYHRKVAELDEAGTGSHHIDIPFSLDTQRCLLTEAGFQDFDLIRHEDESAVYTVRA